MEGVIFWCVLKDFLAHFDEVGTSYISPGSACHLMSRCNHPILLSSNHWLGRTRNVRVLISFINNCHVWLAAHCGNSAPVAYTWTTIEHQQHYNRWNVTIALCSSVCSICPTWPMHWLGVVGFHHVPLACNACSWCCNLWQMLQRGFAYSPWVMLYTTLSTALNAVLANREDIIGFRCIYDIIRKLW